MRRFNLQWSNVVHFHIKMKRKLDDHDVPAEVPSTSTSFDGMGLDPRLLQAVANDKFSQPTPVQARAIPLALEGKDILGMLRDFEQRYHWKHS